MRVILLVVVLLGTPLLVRAEASAEALGRARRLADDLGSRYLEEREAAKAGLIALGQSAEPVLQAALRHSDPRVRQAVAEALGAIGSKTAVETLLDLLESEAAGEVRERANLALVVAGEPAREALVARLAHKPGGSAPLERAMENFVRSDVETCLSSLITERYSYGFYGGQFAAIEGLARPAVNVLMAMFTKPAYPFLMPDPKRCHIMRQLAGEALADMKDPSIMPELEALFHSKTAAAELGFDRQELEDTLAYVMFKLGRPEAMRDMSYRLESYLEGSPDRTELRPRLTGLLVRMGEFQRAEAYYRMIAEDDGNRRGDWAYYNLACLYSIQKKIPEALRHLQKAVDAGFTDVDWIKQDGDLRNIRNHPGYQAIVQDLEARVKR